MSGTRWGEYALTGTFDGRILTGTEVLPAASYSRAAAEPDEPLGTPCPEPTGGWQVLDPGTTTSESMAATFEAAHAMPDLAMAWMDQTMNPASTSTAPAEIEQAMNDPSRLIINVAVTGDTTAAEATLRTTWGGMLCVSQATHTEDEMLAILDELSALPGFVGGGGISRPDHAEVTLVFDDGSIQDWVDRQYGSGLVSVQPVLVPAG